MSRAVERQVLIVGAGPVGLTITSFLPICSKFVGLAGADV